MSEKQKEIISSGIVDVIYSDVAVRMTPEQYERLRKEIDETMKAFNKATKEAAKVITEFAAALHYAMEELEQAKRP